MTNEWRQNNKMEEMVQTWGDYDKERQRRITNIRKMEFKLKRATENLYGWDILVVKRLNATIGERE